MLRNKVTCFGLEDCFAINCTLKFICSSQEKRRTLRIKSYVVQSTKETGNIDINYIIIVIKIWDCVNLHQTIFFKLWNQTTVPYKPKAYTLTIELCYCPIPEKTIPFMMHNSTRGSWLCKAIHDKQDLCWWAFKTYKL